jgi:glutathione S-transferase
MSAETDTIEITAYSWIPPFARGLVRDLRVRWTLEEIGLPYRTQLFDRRTEQGNSRIPEQPFGQVPAFRQGDVRMFETGAICLYLAERSDTLLPSDEVGRTRAMCWAFAALNSVEPAVMQLSVLNLFEADKPWAGERRPMVEGMVHDRLQHLSDALGERDWLEDRFTVGDLLMTTVLRNLKRTKLLDDYPNLAAYRARAEARPAFQRALEAQFADFIDDDQERMEA